MTPPAASTPYSPPRESTRLVVATVKTRRVTVAVSRIAGKPRNPWGVRSDRDVSMDTTASVRLAESRTSSNSGGMGMTNTRIAPTRTIGSTNPEPRPQPVVTGLDAVGGILSPPQTLGYPADTHFVTDPVRASANL